LRADTWKNRVRLQHLRTVLAVARSSSVSRAADVLGLTQPAVTRILHDLETELEVPLFVRTSRGTHCTPFGQTLADHAELVFAQLDRAAEEIREAREGLSGRVMVGVLVAGAASILPPALVRFQRERPGVRVTLIEGTYDYLIPLLHQGTLDFVCGRLPAYRYREGLTVEAFYQEEVALVTRPGHPVLTQEPVSLETLSGWPWILPLPDTTLRQLIDNAFLDLGLPQPQVACQSVSVVANRRMVMDTDWICAFPRQVIEPDLAAGLLARIPLAPSLSFGPVGVCHRQDVPLSRAAEGLLAILRTKPVADSSADA